MITTRAFLVLAIVAACGSDEPARSSALGSAEQAELHARVREMFAAVAARDCARVGAVMPEATDAPGKCEAFLEEWNDELHVELVDLRPATLDGRDRESRLVTASVRRRGKLVEQVFKLERRKDQWVISH